MRCGEACLFGEWDRPLGEFESFAGVAGERHPDRLLRGDVAHDLGWRDATGVFRGASLVGLLLVSIACPVVPDGEQHLALCCPLPILGFHLGCDGRRQQLVVRTAGTNL